MYSDQAWERVKAQLSVRHLLAALAMLSAAVPAGPVSAQSDAGTIAGTTAAGIYYAVSGAGEPVVFIHAFSVDRRMWDPQVAEFERRYRVIRYDLRGHGRSVAPTEPYTGHDDLRALLDTLGITRATLVGLSAGAELAINFAIAYPDRAAALVLAAPGLGGYSAPPLPWARPVFEAAAAGDAERAAKLWAETPIMALHTSTHAAGTVAALVMDNARLWGYQRTEQPLLPPAVDRLEEIACPALILIGDHDLPHIKDIAHLLADRIVDVALVTIPGAGHFPNLDRPELFNVLVAAFLARQ
jgi:3-oxoadipate enol-lactonase